MPADACPVVIVLKNLFTFRSANPRVRAASVPTSSSAHSTDTSRQHRYVAPADATPRHHRMHAARPLTPHSLRMRIEQSPPLGAGACRVPASAGTAARGHAPAGVPHAAVPLCCVAFPPNPSAALGARGIPVCARHLRRWGRRRARARAPSAPSSAGLPSSSSSSSATSSPLLPPSSLVGRPCRRRGVASPRPSDETGRPPCRPANPPACRHRRHTPCPPCQRLFARSLLAPVPPSLAVSSHLASPRSSLLPLCPRSCCRSRAAHAARAHPRACGSVDPASYQ